jgi:hypothetical protein
LKTTYTCCSLDFNNSSRLYYSDSSGSRTVTPTTNGNSLPDWQPIVAPRPAAFDFDGDGRSDQAIFRPSTNDWWYLSSINSAQLAFNWGTPTDTLAPADYDGDMKTDIAVWRPSTGDFHILNSFNSTARIENFGLAGDIPTGGDFDGDGKAEVAVYRPGGAQSTFYYRASMGNPQGNITVVNWGLSGDKPVVGDYDGDGRADAAVYRPIQRNVVRKPKLERTTVRREFWSGGRSGGSGRLRRRRENGSCCLSKWDLVSTALGAGVRCFPIRHCRRRPSSGGL